MSGVFDRSEVAKHGTAEDCWVIVDDEVFDVTKFLKFHPAGAQIIVDLAGKDVSREFWAFHAREILDKYRGKFKVGKLAPDAPVEGKKKKGPKPGPPSPSGPLFSTAEYAESPFWQGYQSPFYNESHRKFRIAMREWVHENIMPNLEQLVKGKTEPPKAIFQKMGQAGILAAFLGPGKHLQGYKFFDGSIVAPEKFDYFHEQIAHEEIYRIGAPGVSDGFGCGLVIGLPPVFKFGSKELAARVVPQVLSGDKKICLAISEPAAGSDVANVQCRAVKSADGSHYIVTGVKKWITNGFGADYFSAAVRTGGKGAGGVSMLLIEKGPGVTTSKIETGYEGAAGTALVVFENVKVPVGNLLGKENQGFKCIMHNFNHERWFISVISVACARRCTEEAFKWAMQRSVFGKPLMEQAVTRAKLGKMLMEVEGGQAYLDSVTYQMNVMPYEQQNLKLGGVICLLKTQLAKMNESVSNEAAQLFGGRGITQTGMGKIVWRYRSANQFNGILGGSNEVLTDFAVRQASRSFPAQAKL